MSEIEEYEATPRISRITVERLFNLGNYEHVRYGLTIDIPERSELTVQKVLTGVERILEALNPARLKACDSEDELKRKALRLQEAALLPDDEFARQYGQAGCSYQGTRDQYQERMRQGYQEAKERREKTCALAAKARQMLDDLGGAAEWKDAKLSWEDYNYEEDR
jgi:hypothetical protein